MDNTSIEKSYFQRFKCIMAGISGMLYVTIIFAIFYFLFMGLGLLSVETIYSKTHSISTGCKFNSTVCDEHAFLYCSELTNCSTQYAGLMCATDYNSELWGGCVLVGMMTFLVLLLFIPLIFMIMGFVIIGIKEKYCYKKKATTSNNDKIKKDINAYMPEEEDIENDDNVMIDLES
jgi:uncharacterized membrane protein